MLINISITAFTVALLSLLFLSNFLKKENVFSVRNLFLIFALAEVPYLYFLNANQDTIHPYVQAHLQDYEGVFALHLLLKFLFLFTCLITMLLCNPKSRALNSIFRVEHLSRHYLLVSSLILFILTFVLYFLFLNKVGGLSYLLLNLSNKTLVIQGTGFYRNAYLVTSLLSIGFFIFYLSKTNTLTFMNKFFLFSIVSIFFLMLASTGERKNPILVLIYTFMLWNFKISKIKLVTTKNISAFILILIFASLAPILRKSGSTEFYMANPSLLIVDSMPYIGELFKRFSEIDISLFIYSYFNDLDRFWYGSSIVDFFTGLIPRDFYPDKPPLDEGVYIYALAHYYNVTPPTPFHSMLPVGWPLSRVTSGWVHFGPIGVILYAVFTGYILKMFYNISLHTNFSPQSMFMYATLLATNFGISNAFVFNNLMTLFILIIITLIIKSFVLKR